MIDKKQLHEIIQDLLEVVGEKGITMQRTTDAKDGFVTFDTIFKEACSYQRGFLAGQNRSPYKQTIGVGGSIPSSQDAKGSVNKSADKYSPSVKQLKILKEAGIKENVINQMSKLEVSKVIGEYLNSLKRENI